MISFNNKRLRCMIGWLGMLLPWLSVAATLSFPQSISITYYSLYAVGVFMIILGSAGILLMSYKGYDKQDDIINLIAGVFGIGICLFPMEYKVGGEYIKTGLFHLPSNISNIIHCTCAVAFFGLLAYNSTFLFTKSSGEMTKRKKIRNIIYRVCGYGMILSFLLMLIPNRVWYNKTWFTEMLALTFFGISWLTKANCYPFLAADKKIKE